MNQIKCGICPYYNAPDTHCDAVGKPAAKVNVCPQRRIRKAIKMKEGEPVNKLNPRDLAAAVLAGAVTIIFYAACAAVLIGLTEVMIA